jgi:hypothetical protein
MAYRYVSFSGYDGWWTSLKEHLGQKNKKIRIKEENFKQLSNWNCKHQQKNYFK